MPDFPSSNPASPRLQSLLAHGRGPLLFALRSLPPRVHASLLALGFNGALRAQSLGEHLRELEHRRVCLHVSDAPCSLYWRIGAGGLEAADPGPFDVRISGTVADLFRLAVRAEDPDTLFFSRRLCLEGDTETGLYIKNLIDALEFNPVPQILGRGLSGRSRHP